MPDIFAVPAQAFRQYDGTNSGDIVEWIESHMSGITALDSIEIISEEGGVLQIDWTFHYIGEGGAQPGSITLPTGDWISDQNAILPAAELATNWLIKPVE